MSIALDATAIKNFAERLERLRKDESAATDLKRVGQDLAEMIKDTDGPAKTVRALVLALAEGNQAAVCPTAETNATTLLTAALNSVRTKSSEGVRTEQFDLNSIRRVFTGLAIKLNNYITEYWRTLCEREYEPWTDDLIAGLEIINLAEQMIPVKDIARKIAVLTKSPPKGVDDIAQFRILVKKYKDATEAVVLPPFMKSFLQSAGSGAPLDSLTDDVREWLKKNGLMDKFAVKFASQRR